MPVGIYKRTKKHIRNMRKAREYLKGIPRSEEIKRKISLAKIGKKFSEDHKRKLSLAKIGKKFAEEHKNKISLANKGKPRPWLKGENNYNWKGGISFTPYTTDWTETLKRSIRERDKYTCQICGKNPAIDVHHIDYNKKNCNSGNLITLCRSCHIKTNVKRDYYSKLLNNIIAE